MKDKITPDDWTLAEHGGRDKENKCLRKPPPHTNSLDELIETLLDRGAETTDITIEVQL